MRISAVLIAAAALVLAGTAAANASGANQTCAGGSLGSGTYGNLTVTGHCTVAEGANITIQGNVTVLPGAAFDGNANGNYSVTIRGNVTAGRGATFSLGCTEAHPCANGSEASAYGLVRGNVTLSEVFNAAMNGITIGGNLTSTGGGAGLIPQTGPDSPFIPFSVKDDTVGGNVTVTGLRTVWFGLIRSQVGGNVTLIDNSGTAIGEAGPDSNEVVANTIGGNLVCLNNHPAAQFGDAVLDAPPGYGPNQVHGQVVGECRALV